MTSQSSPDVDYYTGDNAPLDTIDITSQTNTQNMDSQTDHSGETSGQGNYYSDNVTSGTASSTSQVELDPTSNAPLDVLDSSSQAHIENPNTQEDSRSGSGDDTIGDIVNQIEDDSSSTGTSTAGDGDDFSTDGSSYEKDHSNGSTLVDRTDISAQSTNSNIDNPKYHADGSGDQVVNNRDSNGSSTTDELDSDYNSESVDDVDGISQSSDSNIDNPKYYDGETTGQVVTIGDSDINSSGSSMSDEGSEDEYYSESGDEIDATAANEGSKIDSYYELLDDQVDSSSQSINSNIDTSKNYDGETTGQVGYTGNSDINSNGRSLSDEGSEDEYYSDEYYSDSGDERDATSANEGSNIDSYHEPMGGTVDSSSESINSNIDTSKHYDGETTGQVGYNVDSGTNINGSSIYDEGSDNEYYSESGNERDVTTSNEGSDDEYYSESGDEINVITSNEGLDDINNSESGHYGDDVHTDQVGYNVDNDTNINGSSLSNEGSNPDYNGLVDEKHNSIYYATRNPPTGTGNNLNTLNSSNGGMTSQSSPDVDYYTGDNAPLDTIDITSQTNTQNMDSQTDHSGETSGQGNYYSDNVTSGTASSTSQVELDPTSNAPLDVLDSSSQAHIENPNTQEDSRSGSGDDTIGDIVNQIEDDSSSTGTSTADDGDDSSTDGSSYEKDHSDGSLSVDSTLVDQTDISSQSTNINIDNPKYHADGSGDQVVNNRDSNGSSTTDGSSYKKDPSIDSTLVDQADISSQSTNSNTGTPKYYADDSGIQVVNNRDSN